MLQVVLKVRKLLERTIRKLYEEELHKKKKYQKQFKVEKVIKRKGEELYVKWKGYNNSFKSWINKKEIV